MYVFTYIYIYIRIPYYSHSLLQPKSQLRAANYFPTPDSRNNLSIIVMIMIVILTLILIMINIMIVPSEAPR